MKTSSTQIGIQPRNASIRFSSESSESKIEAGLLARSTFAGLLSSEEPMAWICKSCFAVGSKTQTYSCGDSSGFAPDSLLIPRSEQFGLETKI